MTIIADSLGNAIPSTLIGAGYSTALRGLNVKLPTNTPFTLATGTSIIAKVTDSNQANLLAADTNRLGISSISSQLDGANNAVAQTATGVAVATQMVTTGTRYNKLSIKNIGANPVFLGFDNTVNAGNGYELTALTGASDEKLYDGFNANLWAFSTLGTTLSIEGRG